jgi:transcriptional regulator with XRE-family HTH domain
MDRAGEKLKRVRERLKLTYRDVEQASQVIAGLRASDEYAIPLSRLADIENKGTLPTVYRLYTLCAIYRLDLEEVLRWYGVPWDRLSSDTLEVKLPSTHLIHQKEERAAVAVPQPPPEIDLNKTTLAGHIMRNWGKMPVHFLGGSGAQHHRYGLIGLEDWSMYPILRPGSLVVIDEDRKKIATSGWTNEYERPIYFLEHRQGYRCGWCSLMGDRLLVEPHPGSQQAPESFAFPTEIEVVGQVVGAAATLGGGRRRHVTAATAAAKSPGR